MADPVSKVPVRSLTTTDVQSQIADSTGNLITSQTNGAAQRALDVGVNVGGVQIDPRAIRALAATDVVTAAQGAPNTIANSWPIEVTDGTNKAAVKGASSATVAADPALAVSLSPNSPIPAGTNLIGKIEITDGTSIVAVKAASAAAVAADPAQVVALSPNSPTPAGTNLIGKIQITDGTSIGAVKAASAAAVAADPAQVVALSPNTPLPAGTNLLGATNVYSGGNPNSSANPLFVTVGNTTPGTPVNYYNATTSAVAAAGSDSTSVYTITTGKTLSLKKVLVGSSVHMRCDLQISANGTTWTTIASLFTPYGGGNMPLDYDEISIQESGTGSGVRMVFNNEDTTAATGYVSFFGVEN
jgi:hypothetical protein